jgi:hypothetical protein
LPEITFIHYQAKMSATSIAALAAAVLVVFVLILLNRSGQSAAPDVKVLSQLRQAGSDLAKPHAIEFFLYFPSDGAAQRVAQQLAKEGFSSVINKSASGKKDWLLKATKTMIPKTEEIVRLRAWFSTVAASENGDYDGWGTPVVKWLVRVNDQWRIYFAGAPDSPADDEIADYPWTRRPTMRSVLPVSPREKRVSLAFDLICLKRRTLPFLGAETNARKSAQGLGDHAVVQAPI